MSTLTLKKDVPVAGEDAPLVGAESDESNEIPIRIDLGESAGHISYNGIPYHHGRIYYVSIDLARALQETCLRTKSHEATLKNNENVGRRPRPRYA